MDLEIIFSNKTNNHKPTKNMETTHINQISCSTAISRNVKTARDESVGSIKDIVLNTSDFNIAYVVLKVDEGFLNLGSKLLALPPESFEFHPHQEDVIIVKETKETLEKSPGFDSDNWPTGPQAEFIHSIRSYYSEESRSLYGRYDRDTRTYSYTKDKLGMESDRIADRDHGDGFLKTGHGRDRQSDRRAGGNPIL
jgi:hypothetical protein